MRCSSCIWGVSCTLNQEQCHMLVCFDVKEGVQICKQHEYFLQSHDISSN